MVRLREALSADSMGIARVHVASWRTTYRGLLPDDLLAGLSIENRERNWRSMIEAGTKQGFIYVAERDGEAGEEIIGFAAAGFERTLDPVYTGELYAIYLLREAQGQGTGRALVREVARRLFEMGDQAMLVWVLEGNTTARQFYEALGGKYVRVKEEVIGRERQKEVAYGWEDIRVLSLSHPDISGN